MKQFIKERFFIKFPKHSEKEFEQFYQEYQKIKPFKVNENIFESGQSISEEAHYILRLSATYHMREVLKSLKIDLNDPNISEQLESGNIGTFGRIAKMFSGASIEDDRELMSGRFNKPPRMALFPNEANNHNPVFVKTDLNAVCSHHFIRFGEDYFDSSSFIVIGYIPKNYLGGISKINRFVNWCARRGWLQEDLTQYIGKKIEEYFKTDSVYVALFNLKHGCTAYRGACDNRSGTTSIYMSGEFKKNPDLIPSQYRGVL
jgi:GTP cyclohydrolase I